MSKSRNHKQSRATGHARHVSVRAVRRNPPDLRKLSRALIQLAVIQAEAEAAAAQSHTGQGDGDKDHSDV